MPLHRIYGYGAFPGGDPRKFRPDIDCADPDELEAHKAACEAWDRGEQVEVAAAHSFVQEPDGSSLHLTMKRFGLGTYEIEEDCGGDHECHECHPEVLDGCRCEDGGLHCGEANEYCTCFCPACPRFLNERDHRATAKETK